jgi:hypothetical protein
MHRPLVVPIAVIGTALVAVSCSAVAQRAEAVPPPPALAGMPAPAAASAAAAAADKPRRVVVERTAGPPVHVQVIEDDNVRIEEARVRGQPQRITVQPKVGTSRAYEIIVAPGGKDPSQDRGAAGQRTWTLFAF